MGRRISAGRDTGITNAFQIGINVMNLAGTKLYDLNSGNLIYNPNSIYMRSYSFAFRLKFLRIAYINDNDWRINEKKLF